MKLAGMGLGLKDCPPGFALPTSSSPTATTT